MIDDRAMIRAHYGKLVTSVSAVLSEADPIGIACDTDDYDVEATTIIPRLETALSVDDVHSIIHQEFGRWFGASHEWTKQDYVPLAIKIWDLWRLHLCH